MIARAGLGLTEAGNFPAAIKSTAEWFPKKERALGHWYFQFGNKHWAIVAPLTVPAIAFYWVLAVGIYYYWFDWLYLVGFVASLLYFSERF